MQGDNNFKYQELLMLTFEKTLVFCDFHKWGQKWASFRRDPLRWCPVLKDGFQQTLVEAGMPEYMVVKVSWMGGRYGDAQNRGGEEARPFFLLPARFLEGAARTTEESHADDNVVLMHMLQGKHNFSHIQLLVTTIRLGRSSPTPDLLSRITYPVGLSQGIPAQTTFNMAAFLHQHFPGSQEQKEEQEWKEYLTRQAVAPLVYSPVVVDEEQNHMRVDDPDPARLQQETQGGDSSILPATRLASEMRFVTAPGLGPKRGRLEPRWAKLAVIGWTHLGESEGTATHLLLARRLSGKLSLPGIGVPDHCTAKVTMMAYASDLLNVQLESLPEDRQPKQTGILRGMGPAAGPAGTCHYFSLAVDEIPLLAVDTWAMSWTPLPILINDLEPETVEELVGGLGLAREYFLREG